MNPYDTDIRYTYARAKTAERMRDILEDCYADGEVSSGEDPRIEKRTDHRGRVTHYELTLRG